MKKRILKIIKKILPDKEIKQFWKNFDEISKDLNIRKRFPLITSRILNDKHNSLPFDKHYFYHTSWAARVIDEVKPAKIVDISSQLNYIGIISAFYPTEYYEFIKPQVELNNLKVNSTDLVRLSFADNSISFLSCMHVVEHIGLGRYGDSFDPFADLKACNELKRVLDKKGHLLFVVPVAEIQKIEFNAHRIYNYNQVIEMFNNLELIEFALIPDTRSKENLIRHANSNLVKGQKYACGCFHFMKV
jgi:hypothetical protein